MLRYLTKNWWENPDDTTWTTPSLCPSSCAWSSTYPQLLLYKVLIIILLLYEETLFFHLPIKLSPPSPTHVCPCPYSSWCKMMNLGYFPRQRSCFTLSRSAYQFVCCPGLISWWLIGYWNLFLFLLSYVNLETSVSWFSPKSSIQFTKCIWKPGFTRPCDRYPGYRDKKKPHPSDLNLNFESSGEDRQITSDLMECWNHNRRTKRLDRGEEVLLSQGWEESLAVSRLQVWDGHACKGPCKGPLAHRNIVCPENWKYCMQPQHRMCVRSQVLECPIYVMCWGIFKMYHGNSDTQKNRVMNICVLITYFIIHQHFSTLVHPCSPHSAAYL